MLVKCYVFHDGIVLLSYREGSVSNTVRGAISCETLARRKLGIVDCLQLRDYRCYISRRVPFLGTSCSRD